MPYFAYLLTILSEVISDALRIAGEKFNFNRGVEEKAGGLNMVSILYILIGRVSNLSSLSQLKSQSYMLTVAKSFNLLTTIKITFFAITFLPYVAFMRSKSFYRFNHDARLFSFLELHLKFLIKLIQKISIKYTSQFFQESIRISDLWVPPSLCSSLLRVHSD